VCWGTKDCRPDTGDDLMPHRSLAAAESTSRSVACRQR
jgi:hypothetical protein